MSSRLRSLLLATAVGIAAIGAAAAAEGDAITFLEPNNLDAVAVLIGVEAYGKRDVPKVEFAHEDVAAIKRWLVERRGFDPMNVIELLDPTKGRLEAVLGNRDSHEGQLFDWLRPGRRSDVFVYYSGHGVPALEAEGRSYLLPADGDPDRPKLSAYPLDVLYANLAKLGARSVTLVLETCFSGESAGGTLLPRTSAIYRTRDAASAPEGLTVIRAAGRNEVASWDEEARLGLLTGGFLAAVAGAADRLELGGDGNGRVTLGEVGRYLEEEVGYQARRRFGRRQRPEVEGDPGLVLANLPAAGVLAAPAAAVPPEEPTQAPAPAPQPQEVELALDLGRDDWREVQRALTALGHDPGPADGRPGRRTREALAAWQRARDAEGTTGYLRREDKDALLAEAAPALCDQLAGPQVTFAALDGPAAMAACATAVARDPNSAQLQAQYGLGLHKAGKEAEAVAWYRKAAAQGNARAQNNLGAMYEEGRVVTKDDAEAVAWYRKAAAQGFARAQANLGWMYAEGRGVARDDAEAVAWYRKAVAQGDAKGQNNLGAMYANGRAVTKDDAEAVAWYRKAAAQGFARAQANLGWMYEEGRAVTKDDAEAVAWYRKAAAQGDAVGQANLGWMYENGHGVARDDAEAVAWYRKAAAQGFARAQNNLGGMYEEGRGVARIDAEAVAWYRKAAAQGFARAQANLGWMYENGRGIAKSLAEAKRWYEKAAAQGDEKAKEALKRLGLS